MEKPQYLSAGHYLRNIAQDSEMEKVIVSLHMFDVCACLINGPKIPTKELFANGMYDMYCMYGVSKYMCTTQFQPKDHYWIA